MNDSRFDWKGIMPTARVDIITRDGTTLTGTGEGTPGSIDNPMDWPEVSRKFAECARAAKRAPTQAAIAEVVEQATSPERVSDATVLVRALA